MSLSTTSHVVKLAALEAAILAVLRDGVEEGLDGLSIEASLTSGTADIDLVFTSQGVPVSGQSL